MLQDEEVYSKMNTFSIESRRYIGSKTKLIDWIMDIISKEAPNAQTFCDVFAGTGTVSSQAISRYREIIVNDFLYSNHVIYNGFFANGVWDKVKLEKIIAEYNQLKAENIEDNYFSLNYGDKYFGKDLAKIIGFIRQDIEDRKRNLTEKEYHILLSSLIYSMDRVSNTIGHYEAYLKKPIPEHYINMRLIDAHCFDNVRIFREDSNQLVRHVAADVFYVDPPYNSRQYSRFYHVYETLVHWDKRPLFGVAMKPQVENMSEYCSCRARDAFADLISNMDAKYIFVFYNNTYHSRSKSSQNKITLEEIRSILETKGETKILEHAYQFFNAGKTDFKDHKELLFVTKVYSYDK